jgi:hypothetical protein
MLNLYSILTKHFMESRFLRLSLLVSLALCSAGCPKKINTLKPDTPPNQPIPLKPAGVSRMKLPVLIEPIDISRIETETPKTFGGSEDIDFLADSQLRYFVWRKPLQPSFVNDTVRAQLHSYFYGIIENKETGGRTAQCGYFNEPAQERVFNSSFKLEWAPDWHVKSTTSIQMDPAPFPCILTIFHIDVTRHIDRKLNELTSDAGRRVDAYIAQTTNVRPQAVELWSGLRATKEIAPRVWFQMHPTSVALAPIEAVPTDLPSIFKLKTSLEIKASPEITIGNEPSPDTTSLPQLGNDPTGRPGFDLHVDLDLAFCDANEKLAQEFPLTINYGRHRIVLSEPKMESFGNQILLRLTVDNGVNKIKRPPVQDVWGGIKKGANWVTDKIAEKLWKTHGVVFLTGTPTFDSKTRDIFFPDLDFEVHTQNVLLKAVGWIFHSPLRDQLRYKARLNVGQQLDDLRMGMNKTLNQDLGSRAHLSGYTDSVDGESIYVTETSIRARVKAWGEASLTLKP